MRKKTRHLSRLLFQIAFVFLAVLFKLDGETLIVCYDLFGATRPTAYATTAGTKLMLEIYKRTGKQGNRVSVPNFS